MVSLFTRYLGFLTHSATILKRTFFSNWNRRIPRCIAIIIRYRIECRTVKDVFFPIAPGGNLLTYLSSKATWHLFPTLGLKTIVTDLCCNFNCETPPGLFFKAFPCRHNSRDHTVASVGKLPTPYAPGLPSDRSICHCKRIVHEAGSLEYLYLTHLIPINGSPPHVKSPLFVQTLHQYQSSATA